MTLEERRSWQIGVAVVAAACLVRLALVTTSRFTGDEADFYRVALDIAEGRALPLLGPPITGGVARHPGPLFYWLMALPMLFTRAPEAVNALVAVLGGITVGIYWHALRRPFGEAGALTAAALMVCTPWSTLYADRIWNSNVVGLPIALAFWSALRMRTAAAAGEDTRAIVLLLPAAAVIPQFHMSAPVLWAALVPLAWPGFRRAPRNDVVMGLAIVVLLYVPTLVSELGSGCANVRAFLRESQNGHSAGWMWVPLYVARFLTLDVSYQLLTGYWARYSESDALLTLVRGTRDFPFSPLRFAALLVSVVTAAAAVVVAGRQLVARRGRAAPYALAALVGVVVDMVLLGTAGKPVFAHYVQPLLPFLFVVFAVLGRAAATRPIGRPVVAALVLVTCIGGLDATWLVSSRLDARSGIAVTRAIVERLDADALDDDIPRETPVRLDFGFFSVPHAYEVLASRALDVPLHLDKTARTRRYRVQRDTDPVPTSWNRNEEPLRTGPVVLYRLR